jgi:acyl carrier protein
MSENVKNPLSIRSTIFTLITEIANQQNKSLAPLSDSLPLIESGLDSLCIAILVASLDERLDLDPFPTAAVLPVTLGDFVALYENAAV